MRIGPEDIGFAQVQVDGGGVARLSVTVNENDDPSEAFATYQRCDLVLSTDVALHHREGGGFITSEPVRVQYETDGPSVVVEPV